MTPYLTPEVQTYNHLLEFSFHNFTGESLIGRGGTDLTDAELAEALFYLPQAIVSHGVEADPVFRYANRAALDLWEMDWDSFIRLPSRMSAEPTADIQSDRDGLLKAALQKGWIDHYAGVRISSTGKRFEIRDTVLWNVVDPSGVRHGQAAFIRSFKRL